MNRLIVMIPVLIVFATINSLGQSKISARLGVVNSEGIGQACLAIPNATLQKGQRMYVVDPHKAQRVFAAIVGERQKTSCSSEIDVYRTASFYLIRVSKNIDPPFLGIVLVRNRKPSLKRGIATVDLNDDGKHEYFRTCTSNEGVHLTIWTGKPLIGKRIWHQYYYLGYDTNPTCRKKDYEGID